MRFNYNHSTINSFEPYKKAKTITFPIRHHNGKPFYLFYNNTIYSLDDPNGLGAVFGTVTTEIDIVPKVEPNWWEPPYVPTAKLLAIDLDDNNKVVLTKEVVIGADSNYVMYPLNSQHNYLIVAVETAYNVDATLVGSFKPAPIHLRRKNEYENNENNGNGGSSEVPY